jgi:hypothetical protein
MKQNIFYKYIAVFMAWLFGNQWRFVSCYNCKFGEFNCICYQDKMSSEIDMNCILKTLSNQLSLSIATLNDSHAYGSINLSDKSFDSIPNNSTGNKNYTIRDWFLDNNKLTSIKPFAFIGVTGLTDLSLNDNFLTDLGFLSISGMNTLQFLSLNRNSLNYLNPVWFIYTTSLIQLHFNNNLITALTANLFLNQLKLQALNFLQNNIETIHPQCFINL